MHDIGTPVGRARLHTSRAPGPAPARATLLLGHGAGGGVDAPDLLALAEGLPALGVTVVRVEQPWRVAGRRVATPPATLDRAWLVVLEAMVDLQRPLVVGGRSAGARVACRTAVATGAVAVLALAFPLRPPARASRPDAPRPTRLPELAGVLDAGLPVLVVQGERDPFGAPDAFPRERPPGYQLHVVPGDHSLRRTEGLARRVGDWLLEMVPETAALPGVRESTT